MPASKPKRRESSENKTHNIYRENIQTLIAVEQKNGETIQTMSAVKQEMERLFRPYQLSNKQNGETIQTMSTVEQKLENY